ncbi:MAG: LacI family DNA-binding transcriptional regulator [Oscillospiraceae bacterium]|nr:LacI family DNA-binding transcriptional regulator [Oscillospiraceae bacterium]
MSVSILDVAKHCGLSTVTVSRVINHSGHVKEINRQKVLKAIQELGYTPNAAARSLVMGRTGLIGVVLSDLTNTYSNKVITALKNHLLERGYLITFLMFEDIVQEGANRYILDELRVDGYFIITPALETKALEKLRRYGQPILVLDRQMDNVLPPYIEVDDYQGGVIAAEHLLSLGHTKIGYIDGPDMLCCRERRAGLCDTLAKAGLSLYAEEQGGSYEYSLGYRTAKLWHSSGRMPTAIFACCDSVAMGAIDALRRRGYEVPADVSVMGFDNIPLFKDYDYQLTTVEQPVEEIAACAVEMMMSQLRGEQLRSNIVKLAPRFIPGNSTGVCPAGR